MTRTVNVVLLCEDRQHEVFARKFLDLAWKDRQRNYRLRIAPPGQGSGEQFVREQYAKELAEYRHRRNRVETVLIVVRDADGKPVADRVRQLEEAAVQHGQPARRPDERVAILVPARNIETWIAYLEGAMVDETRQYPHLRAQRDCRPSVKSLHQMCEQNRLREPAPSSLVAACVEYRQRLLAR